MQSTCWHNFLLYCFLRLEADNPGGMFGLIYPWWKQMFPSMQMTKGSVRVVTKKIDGSKPTAFSMKSRFLFLNEFGWVLIESKALVVGSTMTNQQNIDEFYRSTRLWLALTSQWIHFQNSNETANVVFGKHLFTNCNLLEIIRYLQKMNKLKFFQYNKYVQTERMNAAYSKTMTCLDNAESRKQHVLSLLRRSITT